MERNYTKIYFLGIGGIGMSALANLAIVDSADRVVAEIEKILTK